MADLKLLRHHSPEKHHKISKNPRVSWIQAVWLLNTGGMCSYEARGTAAHYVTVLVYQVFRTAHIPLPLCRDTESEVMSL